MRERWYRSQIRHVVGVRSHRQILPVSRAIPRWGLPSRAERAVRLSFHDNDKKAKGRALQFTKQARACPRGPGAAWDPIDPKLIEPTPPASSAGVQGRNESPQRSHIDHFRDLRSPDRWTGLVFRQGFRRWALQIYRVASRVYTPTRCPVEQRTRPRGPSIVSPVDMVYSTVVRARAPVLKIFLFTAL